MEATCAGPSHDVNHARPQGRTCNCKSCQHRASWAGGLSACVVRQQVACFVTSPFAGAYVFAGCLLEAVYLPRCPARQSVASHGSTGLDSPMRSRSKLLQRRYQPEPGGRDAAMFN